MTIINNRTLTARDLHTINDARLSGRVISVRFSTADGIVQRGIHNIREGWWGCKWDELSSIYDATPPATDCTYDGSFLHYMSDMAASGAEIKIHW